MQRWFMNMLLCILQINVKIPQKQNQEVKLCDHEENYIDKKEHDVRELVQQIHLLEENDE